MPPEIITRKEAAAKGLKHYYNGVPCPRGHLGNRYVRYGQCLQCLAEDVKAKYKKNPEYWVEWRHKNLDKCKSADIKRKFGITLVEFEAMMAAQNGICLICEVEFWTLNIRDVAIDHDHVTGKLRGILCRKCNTGIGMMNDDVNVVKRAVKYLEGSICERILATTIDKAHTIHESLDAMHGGNA